jgi:hypothetical protein
MRMPDITEDKACSKDSVDCCAMASPHIFLMISKEDNQILNPKLLNGEL